MEELQPVLHQTCTTERPTPFIITLPPSGQKLSVMDWNIEDILSPHISVLKISARG